MSTFKFEGELIVISSNSNNSEVFTVFTQDTGDFVYQQSKFLGMGPGLRLNGENRHLR